MPGPRPAPPASRVIRAGGALVWQPRADLTGMPRGPKDIDVLLVHRPKYDDWSWPKGKQEPGEHIVACATREVEEETGVPVTLGTPLTTQRYKLGRHTTKEVHYWLATPTPTGPALLARPPAPRAPEREIDRVKWVSPSKAMRLLTRRGDRRLLAEALDRLEDGTLATDTLAIVRHGKAYKRSDWEGDSDAGRPLGRAGVHQVGRLTPLLSAYGIDRLVTSPWRRCLATVAPYATLTGAALDRADALTESQARTNPDALRATYRDLITAGGPRTAVCIHRPTLPTLVGELALLTANKVSRRLPQGDDTLHTAEALIVHLVRDGDGGARVVDLERHRP